MALTFFSVSSSCGSERVAIAFVKFCFGRQRHHYFVFWGLFRGVLVFRDEWKIGILDLFRRNVVIVLFGQSSVVMACSLVFSFWWLFPFFFLPDSSFCSTFFWFAYCVVVIKTWARCLMFWGGCVSAIRLKLDCFHHLCSGCGLLMSKKITAFCGVAFISVHLYLSFS